MHTPKPLISIISPVYRCKECLYELYVRVNNTMKKLNTSYELIFVDDNSPDGSWNLIQQLSEKDHNVKGIRFSKNFGQHKAIYAGLEKSQGEWVVVMDCDLQDRPEEIETLYNTAKSDSKHIVLGRRTDRQHNVFKQLFSRLFYKILGYLTDTYQDSRIANFGIYNRKVIGAICSMNDSFKYFPTMVRWVGFKHQTINIVHDKRKEGKTSYSIKKLINLGLDVVLAFSEKPLRLTVKLGLTISLLSFIFGVITIFRYFTDKIEILGYASQILSIWLLGGIIIFILGIVGLYVGKTFEKVKERPVYIIEEEIGYE